MTNLGHDVHPYNLRGPSTLDNLTEPPPDYYQQPPPPPSPSTAATDDEAAEDEAPESLPPFSIGEYGQPVINRLSVNDDRLKIWADLQAKVHASGGHTVPHPLLSADYAEVVTFGPFTLVPAGYGAGICRRLYDVHHKNQSDPVATLMSHPRKGTARRVWYTMANRLNYTGEAVPLGVELLDALQATADGLSHYELAADAVALSGVVGFIHTAGLVRKHGRKWWFVGNKRNEIKIGVPISAKYGTVYPKGKRLNRENKQYQGRAAVAANVVAPEDVSGLMRLEWNLKAKAAKALRYKGQPVTLRTLLDPLARLSILRQQTEAGFTFKYPGRAGAVVPFFNWPAIDAAYRAQNGLSATGPPTPVTTKAPRPRARKSTAIYGAKQAIRKLIADSRPGDYLAATTRPELETMTAAALKSPRRIRKLARTLSAAGCGVDADLLATIVTDWMTNAAAPAVAAAIAPAAPDLLARAIAAEHDLDHYLGRQYVARRRLPAVHRPPDSLAALPPAPRL